MHEDCVIHSNSSTFSLPTAPMVAVFSCSLEPLPHSATRGLKLNARSRALFLLQKCQSFNHFKQIHAQIIRNGLSNDQVLLTKLISLSASSFRSLHYPMLLFDQIHSPSTFTCNIMIRAFTCNAASRNALLLYTLMLHRGIPPDKFTFPFIVKACFALHSLTLQTGRALHTHAVKAGFSTDIYFQNTLMDLYLEFGDLEHGRLMFDKMRVRNVVSWTTMVAGLVASGEWSAASELFEAMPVRNVVSWTVMINGYVRNGRSHEAFDLFRRMQAEGVRPNEFTLVGLLLACTELGSLSLGRWIHEFACNNGFEMSIFLCTALIDMYSKCGSLKDALKVFEEMPERSTATWNSMITSLGVHGRGNEAIALFAKMDKENAIPDEITFVGVLSACVNARLVQEGCEFFKIMTDHYGIVPTIEHYCCMFELLGRAEIWHGAYELAENIPGTMNVFVWKALLKVCETHGNAELGKVAYRRIVELDSMNDSMSEKQAFGISSSTNDYEFQNQTQLQHHCFECEVE